MRTVSVPLDAATGTSHHDSNPGMRFSGSVGTTMTVTRSASSPGERSTQLVRVQACRASAPMASAWARKSIGT